MTIMDTDVCVELLRGNKRVVEHRREMADDVAISFMTLGELFYGAQRSTKPAENRELIERFLLTVMCVHSDRPTMERFGDLKADLTARGEIPPDADILIAATALSSAGQLVSGNKSHFSRFAGLKVLDWTR